MKLYQDKEWLEQKYWEEKLSLSQMAELAECGRVTIQNWMIRFKIKRRTIGESRTGEFSPWFGKHLPKKTREKISAANMGKKMSEEAKKKISKAMRGSGNPNWKNGRRLNKGYVWVWTKNGYEFEQRQIAEKALGRKLRRGERVHHINLNKADNRNENLLICTILYHRNLHQRMKKADLQ